MRSADRLREDFYRMNDNPNIHFVSIYHDFLTLMKKDHAFKVLDKDLNLKVRMEFNSKPDMEQVELMLNRFKGGVINFSIDHKHLTSADIINPQHMIKLIKRVQAAPGFFTVLSYNSVFAKNNPEDKKGLNAILKATRCLISDESFYWTEHPIPDKKGLADEDMFDAHIEYSKDQKFVKSPITKLYDSAEPFMPYPLTMGIRKTQQWMVENLPYYAGLK